MINNILYWNVRVLGSLKKRLKHLISKKEVSVCAIAEPFARSNRLATMGNYLSLYNFCSNDEFGCKIWIF